jgi:hypothetical protein
VNLSTPSTAQQPPCDRVAFYASKRDPSRTLQQPVRSGASIPARFERHGDEFVLLSYVTPLRGETVDEAIARESAELQELVAEIEAEARAASDPSADVIARAALTFALLASSVFTHSARAWV